MSTEDPKIERLWAPWRLEHIQAANKDRENKNFCPFCEIASEACSENNLKLYQSKHCFVVMNKFPYNPHHLLVIPNIHCAMLNEVNSEVWQDLSSCIKASCDLIMERVKPHGMNVGLNMGKAGGASIAGHLHFHLLPRWEGDTNFMPLLAEAKSIPVHNLSVYKNLETHFADFDKFLKQT